MLDLTQYESLGAALTAAIGEWPGEICLIEADRDRERGRLTYRQFADAALPLAAALEETGFAAGDRAAIIMSNQSKWLISAYAIFYAGGVLVPLDYKLNWNEHCALVRHSKSSVLVVEYPFWLAITQSKDFRISEFPAKTVLVVEAPSGADLSGAQRWEAFSAQARGGGAASYSETLRYGVYRLLVGHRRGA